MVLMQPNIQDDLRPDIRNKPLYGFYRGCVIENRDRSIDKEDKIYGRISVHVPAISDDEEVVIWCCPANNPIGGRNDDKIAPNKNRNGGKHEHCGSVFIPPINSWVWVFFENGDPNRPFYWNGVDIKAKELPPELRVKKKKQKPEERWLIYRSPYGRVIIVSDDPDNERLELTGKKRKPIGGESDNEDEHVYKIIENQKTILIDERKGKEKIIIKDERNNFINLNTKLDDLDIWTNMSIRLHSKEHIWLKSKHISIEATEKMEIFGKILDEYFSDYIKTKTKDYNLKSDTNKIDSTDKISLKSTLIATDSFTRSNEGLADLALHAVVEPERPPCGGRECEEDCGGGQECIDKEKYE